MKKLLTFLAIAALVAVSCAKEQNGINEEGGPLANISFTVNSAELMTKADPADPGYAQATAINQLLVQVFNKVGDDFVKLESPEMTITPGTTSPLSWTVDMKLAKNETYKIAFWAQKAETGIYGTSDLSAVTVDYSKIAINNDDADAFCAARLITVSGALSQTVTLYRPLAQINIGTNDKAAYEKSVPAAKKNLTATITLPAETPNKLNVIGGAESEGVVKSAVSGTTTEEVVFTTAPSYVMTDQTLVSSSVNYDYLTMLYVLATPGKETMTFKAKLNNGSTDVSDLTVSNMPYQANYRTNVVGQLLTGSFQYLVEIEEGFYADYEKLVAPSFSTLAGMNAYLAGLKEGTPEGDNGDINPEQVVLTAMGAVTGTPKIVLPKIHGDVDIRLAFEFDGTLQIEYADGATDAQKPANIYFYAQKLNTLEATVPASHFELLSGSVVTNKAIVATNTTTFVIQNGAKVGTAEIQKGNAEISGKVDVVSVPAGAKADDSGAPVQIKLEKESAVEQIVLNAATDVVVEQPKDNIEVSGTEYKVEVVVNVDDCSATAQNGGQIYVRVLDGVTCDVTADGQSSAEEGSVASAVTIAEVGTGATVNTEASDGGQIIPPAPEDNHGEIAAYVAKIGEAKYLTIEEAVAAVKDGETIIVLTDITQDNGILFDKENISAKLDLNSKTITINSGSNVNSRAFRIDNGALEVYDGSIIAVGAGTNSSNGTGCYGAFRIEANGELIAHDLTLKNSRPWGLNVKVLGGTAILTNVSITSSYGGGIEVTEADLGAQSKKGTAVLTNCHFTQTGYFDHCSSTLSVSGGSSLTINSGSYESDNYALYVFSSGGEITVNDGTFSGNKDGVAIVAAIDLNTYPSYTGGLKLKDGVYQGGYAITSPAYMEVSGGKYSVDPADYVAEGYAAIAIEEDPYYFQVVSVDTYEIEVSNLAELQSAIDLKFKNIKYVGSEPIDASFTVTPTVATTVKNLSVAYTSASSSDPAMTINGPMTLKNAQISSKSRCTLEIAEGQTSTLDGCTISNAGYGSSDARAINVNGGTVVTITGCVFSVSNPQAYTRGLNVLGDGAEISVVNSTITAGEYAINLPSTAVNTSITVTGSTINGWAIYNVWKDNNTIEFTECTLNSLNDKGYSSWNTFCAFKYNDGTQNDVIVVTDCEIKVESTTGNQQYLCIYGGTGHQLKLKGQTIITGTNTNTGQYMVSRTDTEATCDIDADDSVETYWNEEVLP